MKSKLLVAYLIAFAILQSTALANTAQLTNSSHTALAFGSLIRGKNVGLANVTAGGNVIAQCSTATLTGTVEKNNGSLARATIESASFSGTAGGLCTGTSFFGSFGITTTVTNGLPWCLHTDSGMKNDEIQISGGKCTEAPRQIHVAIGECIYEGQSTYVGTFSTEPNDAVVTMNPMLFNLESGGIFCPSQFAIDVSYTLEEDKEGTQPVYFSAAPELTYPTGTRLATGSKVKAHNIGELKLTPTNGSFSCSTAELTGALNTNNGSEIAASVEATNLAGTGSLADCTSTSGSFKLTTNVTNGLPWCVRANGTMQLDEFQIRGGGCAESSRAIKFTMDITGTAECAYERSAAISGTFTTHPEDAVFTISGAEFTKTAGPETCPVAPKLDWTFTLERDEEGTHPVYIS